MELNIIDEQVDNDMDERFAHYEKAEVEKEVLLKNYSIEFHNFTKSQSFSYFIGGAILCYRKIFRFLNIDNPISYISSISYINSFVSYKSHLLSKKSDIFRELMINILFSNGSNISDLSSLKKHIIKRLFDIFYSACNYQKNEDLGIDILDRIEGYEKKKFQEFYLKNITGNYSFNKGVHERSTLIYYVLDHFVSEFLKNIDDISVIIENLSKLKKMVISKNELDFSNYFYIVNKKYRVEFNKKINFYYKKYFSDQINNMIRARQYLCYLDIGEETINVMSYLKKSNIEINNLITYNRMIENNMESYNNINKEYPNIFYFSYALLGFNGYNQIKLLKEFLKKPIHSKIKEIQHIKENNINENHDSFENLFFPLSNKGWKYLLSQNKNYTLRASRNLKQSTLCCNLELQDAWLRSTALYQIVNDNQIYYSAYNLIIKSILEHKGAVSKFTGFKNTYIYDNSIKPNKIHLNKILNNIKDISCKINNNTISESDLEMLNILFLLFDYSYYDLVDKDNEISNKYKNIYNTICNICFQSFDNKNNENNENNEVTLNRTSKIQVVFNNTNILSLYQALKPDLKEFTDFLNYSIKYYYRKNSEKFNIFMAKYYAILSGNSYEEDFNGFIDSPYISVRHALQRIKDFINFNYIGNFSDKQNEELENLSINKYLYIDKNFMKNVKNLDHLFELSVKWHKKEQEKELAEINNIEFDIDFIWKHPDFNKKEKCFELKGLKFYPLKNSIEMYHEKLKMKHCIYNYTDLCFKKKYIAFKVEPIVSNVFDKINGQVRATLGCNRLDNNVLSFNQTYSFCDSDVSKSQRKLSFDFVQMLNENLNKE